MPDVLGGRREPARRARPRAGVAPVVSLVLRLARMPVIASAVVYGAGGGAFILATLLMARALPAVEFGAATLIIALGNIGMHASPAGLNGIVLRHDLRMDHRLLGYGLAVIASAAVLFAAVAAFFYDLGALAATMVGAAVLMGGLALLAQSGFKRAQQFARGAAMSQAGNATLLFAALLMLGGVGRAAWFPTAAMAAVFAVIAVLSWAWLRRHGPPGRPAHAGQWRDALHFAGMTVAAEVLIQMERLLIPAVLSLGDLALFAVVAAVAIAPFRMLELGIEMTFTARLRATRGHAERMALLRREARLAFLLCAAGGTLALFLGGPLCELVLQGEGLQSTTELSEGLLLAAALSGSSRVLCALTRAVASAFCTSGELRLANLGAWLALVVGAGAGFLLARYGLVGLVYGVACGWLVRSASALLAARAHLRA